MKGLTNKQEAFCREYIKSNNAADAYRKAGYSTNQCDDSIRQNASKLLTNLLPTIEKMREPARQRHEITIDKLTTWLEAALKKAMAEPKGASAAVSAVLGIGKLHGLVIDKKEVTRKRDASDLTIDELYAIASMGRTGDSATDAGEAESDRIH